MKQAVFIVGPESSGTKMLAEAFVRLGYFGDFGFEQRLDDLVFTDGPSKIVLRRSLPHGPLWPGIPAIVDAMTAAKYVVRPVVIFRDKDCCRRSQVATHLHSPEESGRNIRHALETAFESFARRELMPVCVYLGAFVKSDVVRRQFFATFGQQIPDMEFYDPDAKYAETEATGGN